MEARMPVFFDQNDALSARRQERGDGRARGPSADHENVAIFVVIDWNCRQICTTATASGIDGLTTVAYLIETNNLRRQ
jgi:hypothetical protein